MFIRYASAVTSGTFMTLALFYVMQSLIAMAPGDPAQPDDPPFYTLGRTIFEKPVVPDEPEQFEDLRDPVEPAPPFPRREPGARTIGVKMPPPPTPLPPHSSGLTGLFGDGPLVAMVRVEPAYPLRAADKGLEGYVTVEFDVNPDGTVSNISVVDASHPIFVPAAIKATKKFRFKARVVEGVALATHGIQNRFVFHMERG